MVCSTAVGVDTCRGCIDIERRHVLAELSGEPARLSGGAVK